MLSLCQRHTRALVCTGRIILQKLSVSSSTSCRQDFTPEIYDEVTSVPAATAQSLPLMTSRDLQLHRHGRPPRQAWLETLMSDDKLGFVDLHPDVFSTFPRIDILWDNIQWQLFYKKIDYKKVLNRAELRGGGRKPWPQKGTGRARHGSIRSPLWKGGGKSFGPRGPKSYFYMLPLTKRVGGLCAALSVKYAQDRLHIVDTLDLPTDKPEFLQELVESRGWGLSVLFINETDIISENLAVATDALKSYNVMPVYGLNVFSMLKHETLVVSLAALDAIEEKLVTQQNHCQFRDLQFNKRAWHRSNQELGF